MLDTSARLLGLLGLMQTRRQWTGPELAERLEVGARTIRRDIERLRRLGYPVEATPGVAGGYRLAPGASLPPLLLDDDEATAIAVGLRTAAGSAVTGIEETSLRALVKLEQVLPAHLRSRVSAIGASTVTPAAPGPTVDPGALMVLAGACRETHSLEFEYRSRQGAESHRRVEPHSLVHHWRRWYLLAWDCDRQDWRTFRVDRIEGPAETGERFTTRSLPAEGAAEFVAANLTAAPQRYEARVTVRAPAETISARAPGRWGTVEPIDEHSCEYRTGDDDLEWLALRIAMLGAECTITEPPELIEHARIVAERLARASGV